MESQIHVHPPIRPHGQIHRWRQLSRRRRLFLIFTNFLIVVGAAFIVLYIRGVIQDTWIGFVSIIFTALSALSTSLQWLYPVDPSITPIGPFMGIIGEYPSIDPNLIIWRERTVREVYEQLIDHNISAIMLRGINGIGTSTLAGLVCHYAEDQRLAGVGP